MRRIALLLVALFTVSASLPAAAQDVTGLSKQDRAAMLRFAVNNSLFTLYHELGHLLIDRLRLPVLGFEEDAADNFATWVLLQKATPDANQALEDSARGWMLTGERYEHRWNNEDHASGYSPDRERSLQIVCLMVGADGAAFRPVAERYALMPDRQDACFYDYNVLDRSLRGILPSEGEGGTRVDIRYRDGGNGLRTAERAFRSSAIFDTVAEEIRNGYKLDARVRFTAQACGEPNAYYDPQTVEIIFCYELMQDFMDLYTANLQSDGERR